MVKILQTNGRFDPENRIFLCLARLQAFITQKLSTTTTPTCFMNLAMAGKRVEVAENISWSPLQRI